MTWCPPGGEQADQPWAAAADSEGEWTGAPNTAGVSEPAGPHTDLLPHWSHRRLPAPARGAGTAHVCLPDKMWSIQTWWLNSCSIMSFVWRLSLHLEAFGTELKYCLYECSNTHRACVHFNFAFRPSGQRSQPTRWQSKRWGGGTWPTCLPPPPMVKLLEVGPCWTSYR